MKWTVDDGVLTIYGSGPMQDFGRVYEGGAAYIYDAPWKEIAFTKVDIG